jgi:hypothetical protein
MLLNTEKFEKTLLTSWAEFLDIRELREIIKNTAISKSGCNPNCHVKKFSISRFEFIDTGFLIWIETTIQNLESQNNITMEFLMSKNGFIFLNHIQNM